MRISSWVLDVDGGSNSVKIMRKINTNDLVEETWSSPKGKFAGAGKEISEALGRKPQSTT
jgi:hypothetical protein